MLLQVFNFIAAISTEVAHEEVFLLRDIFCHCLLAFVHFMAISAHNKLNLEAAHRKTTTWCELETSGRMHSQQLIHHCPQLLAFNVIVLAAMSHQRLQISLLMTTNADHVQNYSLWCS